MQNGATKKRVGYAYVVGDILHEGHLRHLENCKSMCDFLIVGVLTDEATMERKPQPVMGFLERIRLVSALRVVDMAITQTTYTPHSNVKRVKPDILFESTSHDPTLLAHSQSLIESLGGELIVMPYFPEQSSTKIKEKIRNGEKNHRKTSKKWV